MSLLVETIKVENGTLLNISFHNERMNRSLFEIFGQRNVIDLEKFISVPESAQRGIFKCRIVYDHEIRETEFVNYLIKPVESLKVIEDNEIEYLHKFTNRIRIEELMERRGKCDDIIIVKNNFVTDSSYANVLFRDQNGNWITPATYLLPGTRRASLLQKGLISEATITCNDICKYTDVKLINAMLGLNDTEGIPVKNIF
ncbi:MAG TPA: aminotransferase class IV [Bacteroidales bacterium]|nr:aminotransferase class IV [Bacteroidales bacterium]